MSLFIATHMGMGDMILQNGLVRTLANEHDEVFIPCIKKYEGSAQLMYQDEPKIVPVVVPDDIEEVNQIAKRHNKSLFLGRHNPAGYLLPGKTFDAVFYEQAGVPFENKWSRFKVELPEVATINASPYAFVHEDSERNLTINRQLLPAMELILPCHLPTIWHQWATISNAAELHLIVSCFMCWADCAKLPTKKVAHLYARPFVDPRDDITRHGTWEELR